MTYDVAVRIRRVRLAIFAARALWLLRFIVGRERAIRWARAGACRLVRVEVAS